MADVLACNSSGILTLIESLILMRVSALPVMQYLTVDYEYSYSSGMCPLRCRKMYDYGY